MDQFIVLDSVEKKGTPHNSCRTHVNKKLGLYSRIGSLPKRKLKNSFGALSAEDDGLHETASRIWMSMLFELANETLYDTRGKEPFREIAKKYVTQQQQRDCTARMCPLKVPGRAVCTALSDLSVSAFHDGSDALYWGGWWNTPKSIGTKTWWGLLFLKGVE